VAEYDPQLALRQTIAGILDMPSVFMGGPSRQNLKKADRIIETLRSDRRLMEALRAGLETGANGPADGMCGIKGCTKPWRHPGDCAHGGESTANRRDSNG
jgi:hypothetical protein